MRLRFGGQLSLMTNAIDVLTVRADALNAAVARGLGRKHCLHRWSQLVRQRDGNRCVDCHSRKRLSAHHICRKSFFPRAQFLTGNGITLCDICHRETHTGFNGRPDLSQPVDAQGGEKLTCMQRLFGILADDAEERGAAQEELYFLSDDFLEFLKRMQGYEVAMAFPGARLEQACTILATSEPSVRSALAEANGFGAPHFLLPPGSMYLYVRPRG